MTDSLTTRLQAELDQFKKDGVYKRLNHLDGMQSARTRMEGRGDVVILSSNNYVGLCDVPEVIAAGKAALDRFGAGTGSVRFICGTFTIHRELEAVLAEFVGTEASLSYVSCWNANEGLAPTLLGEQDAVISDRLNHASIIDEVRLAKVIAKCQTAVYEHSDMADLKAKLEAFKGCRHKLVITDGVFSMEGEIGPLRELADLCDRYGTTLVVDDSHATGVLGRTGRGTAEHLGVADRIPLHTSTLGKAMGSAAGGFVTGPAPVIDLLRQRSRTTLFSNSLPPAVAAASLEAFRMLTEDPTPVAKLQRNAATFRTKMKAAGFRIPDGIHPIVPIMIGDARMATDMARDLLDEGIYVIGFSFPVVPKGEARIRVQLSAAHTPEMVDRAVAAFVKVGRRRGVIRS